MATLFQSLSWALVQSLVQGALLYLALRILLWSVPPGRARLRYSLSFLALVVMSCSFFVSWYRGYHIPAPLPGTAFTVISPSSFSTAVAGVTARAGASLLIRQFPSWLGVVYIAGVILMLGRFLGGIKYVVSLRSADTSSPSAPLEELFSAIQTKMNINAPVRLLISARARVPMVAGVLKPVILLPVSAITQLSPRQLEAILLHELAHVKRYDHLANILQAAIETVLFFNPSMWLLSASVRDERERCCDDEVVDFAKDPIIYASALTHLAGYVSKTNSLALTATGSAGKLLVRIQRMVERPDMRLNYSKVVASCILLAVMIGSVAWIKPVLHHKAKKGDAVRAEDRAARSSENVKSPAPVAGDPTAAPQNAAVPLAVTKDKDIIAAGDVQKTAPDTKVAVMEENVLINRLLQDGVVDQVKGFLVERHFKELYVNRQMLPEDVSGKYLQGLSKDIIRVQVFPMEERMRMHPDADFIQLLLPFTFESPCVEKPSPKEGC